MPKPVRIQLSRKRGWKMPANTVKVDRSTGFGNPYRVSRATILSGQDAGKDEWWVESDSRVWMFKTRDEAVKAAITIYRHTATDHLKERARLALRGKSLACWCKLPAPGEPDMCHAAALLEWANSPVRPICEAPDA